MKSFQVFPNLKSQKGQGMVEYSVIVALIAIVAIVVLRTLGVDITDVFTQVSDEVAAV